MLCRCRCATKPSHLPRSVKSQDTVLPEYPNSGSTLAALRQRLLAHTSALLRVHTDISQDMSLKGYWPVPTKKGRTNSATGSATCVPVVEISVNHIQPTLCAEDAMLYNQQHRLQQPMHTMSSLHRNYWGSVVVITQSVSRGLAQHTAHPEDARNQADDNTLNDRNTLIYTPSHLHILGACCVEYATARPRWSPCHETRSQPVTDPDSCPSPSTMCRPVPTLYFLAFG